jgi:hypothetical protein
MDQAEFDGKAAEIEALRTAKKYDGAKAAVKALIVELIRDPDGDELLAEAGRRWRFVSIAQIMLELGVRSVKMPPRWDSEPYVSKQERQKRDRDAFNHMMRKMGY